MSSVGELSVDVKARINDFSQNLNKALGQANSFASRMSTIGNKDFFAPVQKTLRDMRGDFKQIVQGIILAQAFYTGLQGFKQLTAAVYEYTDALNYAQITFSNLFRDADLGKEFVAVLQDFAARSPFDFTDIEKGARQLSAYGVQAKNLMFVMEGIGNLAAVTGDPQTFETVSRAMGQIYSKGKLSAEEMKQLAEAGLNVKEVYARLGVEAGQLGKANIDSATALNTIVEVLNDTYAGAMDAANTTMRGMLANTKDVLLSVSAAIFQKPYETLQRVLKGFQIELDNFQKTFSAEGLAAAIEESFGSEALNRIRQFIAICQYLGNLLYQLLAPALRIVAMYSETFLTVFGTLIRVIAPVVELFAALLNSFLSSAQGARILQTVLMGLVVVKIVGGFVTILTNGLALLGKTLTGVISVVQAAAGALTILTGAEAGAAAGAYGAAAAWKYFTKTLNLNPIVLAITLILTLITAVVGLRSLLGQTSDSLAEMSGVDFSGFLDNIKQATGDATKFEQPFDDASEDIEDANDGLNDTQKKLKKIEGLLSFDEVFKLPEKTDTDPTNKNDNLANMDPSEWMPTDLGDLEIPTVEPLNLRDLLPDLNDIFDWLKEQPWWKIGQIVSNGIASGLKMAKKVPLKVVVDLLEDMLKTAGKALDKFNIKERLAKLASAAEESRTGFKEAGKLLGDEAYKALEKELGPEKAKKLKLKERVNKIAQEAAKGEKAWKETGRKLAKSLEEDLAKELGPEKAGKYKIVEQMESLAEEATKAEAKFAKAGEGLAKNMTKEIEKYLGPVATKELKVAENLNRIAKEAVAGGTAWEEGGAKAARDYLESLNTEFAKASIKGKAPEKALIDLAKELKAAGVVITDAGVELSDDFMSALEKGLGNQKSLGEVASEFGKNFIQAFKSLPKNISEELAKGFTPSAIFDGIKKSFTTEGGESIFKAFTDSIKGAFNPAKIVEFLKVGLKDMGITLIGELLFDELAKWFDNNGLHEASVVADKAGPIIASGLGTAIATKSPWGFVVGALWGALFEDLGKGLENGDWSSFIGQAAGSLGVILSKIAPKLGFSAGGPAGWIGVIGSMISDLIFGSIIQNLRDSGDNETADILDAIDGAVGSAIGMAGTGAAIGTMICPGIGTAIGALAGAIIGALAGFLTDNWGAVSEWWNNTAVPWFKELPGKIQSFFANAGTWLLDRGKDIVNGLKEGALIAWQAITTFFTQTIPTAFSGFLVNADQWLSDPAKNPLAGLWNAIKETWDTIATFFKGIGEAILGFFTNNEDLLHDAGYHIMDGLWRGLQIPWKLITGFFTDIFKNILAFFTGDETWLTKDGEQLLQGLLDGINTIWNNIVTWFTELPNNITKFFINAGIWLVTAGKNILIGAYNGIVSIWVNISTWFQNLPTAILNFFVDAGTWLVTAGKNILTGIYNGIISVWTSIVTWFQELPQKIVNFFTDAGNWLITAGKNILTGFWDGLQQKWKDIQAFFGGIGDWIKDHKGPASYDRQLLVPAGKNIMQGFSSGLSSGYKAIQSFVSGIPGGITGMFNSAGTWLSTAGKNITIGLHNGIASAQNLLSTGVQQIGSAITGAFSNSGTLLVTAGSNIMIGLYNGLVSGFSRIQSFVSQIGTWIANNKGPETYDKKLLIPNGTWIMEGLESGISIQFKDVLKTVGTLGAQISKAFIPPTLPTGEISVPTLSVNASSIPTYTTIPRYEEALPQNRNDQPITHNQIEEVPNPYITSSNDLSLNDRPILYIGTLIADKQGLRELQRKLDVINLERSRYK